MKLLKVLNPAVSATRESYLRAEVEELSDADAGQDVSVEEAEIRQVFSELVDTQAELGEEPRFTEVRLLCACCAPAVRL